MRAALRARLRLPVHCRPLQIVPLRWWHRTPSARLGTTPESSVASWSQGTLLSNSATETAQKADLKLTLEEASHKAGLFRFGVPSMFDGEWVQVLSQGDEGEG